MNASELAIKMLQWEEQKRKLDELEEELKAAVLEIGKTQTVGNVRATFSKGRRVLDWETPVNNEDSVPKEIWAENTEEIPEQLIPAKTQVNWQSICKAMNLDPVVVSQDEPNVKVKLLE